MVLVGIYKTEILKDYRRMYWKSGDDEKEICKSTIDLNISMYPASQIVFPTLFPSDLPTTQHTTNALPFGISKYVFISIFLTVVYNSFYF